MLGMLYSAAVCDDNGICLSLQMEYRFRESEYHLQSTRGSGIYEQSREHQGLGHGTTRRDGLYSVHICSSRRAALQEPKAHPRSTTNKDGQRLSGSYVR